MKTTTIGDQLLEELFPDFTAQLVQAWARSHVEDLATEVLSAMDNRGAAHGQLSHAPGRYRTDRRWPSAAVANNYPPSAWCTPWVWVDVLGSDATSAIWQMFCPGPSRNMASWRKLGITCHYLRL